MLEVTESKEYRPVQISLEELVMLELGLREKGFLNFCLPAKVSKELKFIVDTLTPEQAIRNSNLVNQEEICLPDSARNVLHIIRQLDINKIRIEVVKAGIRITKSYRLDQTHSHTTQQSSP